MPLRKNELPEAARIDGLDKHRTFARIILLFSKASTPTLIIFRSVTAWNDFMGPMIYLNSDRSKTLQLGISMFVEQYSTEYGPKMATSILALIPVLVMFLAFRRFFVENVATSGLKG